MNTWAAPASHAALLLSRYKTRGAVLDTTLFLLLLIGDYDLRRVGQGRTQKYQASDYRLLVQIAEYLDRIILTPNIFTEVDNLSRQDARDTARLAAVVRRRLARVSEIYKPSEVVAKLPEYEKLGITDAQTLILAAEHHLIITDDLPLYQRLVTSGRDAININHIRTLF